MRKIRVRAVLSLAIIMIGVIALPQLVMAYFSNAAAFFKTYPSAATVSSMKYWTDSSVSTHGFTAYFSNARSKWDAAPNAQIGWSATTSYDDAFVRFYGVNDIPLDYAGIAKPYNSNGSYLADPDIGSGAIWHKVHIILNKGYMDANGYTSNMIQKTALHEVGHALGLRHQPDNEGPLDTVMIQGKQAFTDIRSIDKSNVAWKY